MMSSTAPDGGWGWFCVLGACLCHVLIGGLDRSFGVIYLDLLSHFGSSNVVTSGLTSVCMGLKCFGGVVIGFLLPRFTCRQIVTMGGIVVLIGFVSSAFVTSIYPMYFTYGILIGVAHSMAYLPSIVIVGQYFDKRRALAIAVATSGTGIGAITLPVIFKQSLKKYGYKGMMLIMGAIQFHLTICGLLYRPLKPSKMHLESTSPAQTSFMKELDKELEEAPTKRLYHSECVLNDNLENRGIEPFSLEERNNYCLEVPKENYQKTIKDVDGRKLNEDSETNAAPVTEKLCDLSVIRFMEMKLYCLTCFLLSMAFGSMLTLFPALANERGLSDSDYTWLIGIYGISDLLGRLLSGFIFNAGPVIPERVHVYGGFICAMALCFFGLTFCSSFVTFVIAIILFGLASGTVIAQRSVVLIDIIGTEKLASGLGILIGCQGLGTVIGPFIAGGLKDITGLYVSSFYFSGAITCLAGACHVLNSIQRDITKCRQKSEEKSPQPIKLETCMYSSMDLDGELFIQHIQNIHRRTINTFRQRTMTF